MIIVLGRFFIISNRATSTKNFSFFKKTSIRMSSSDNSNVKKDPWSPENYARHANFVPKLPGNDLITSLLLPEHHERILDVGCGDGVLTFQIQERCSQCIGIDKSEKMIQVAGQVNNCKDVRVVDAEKLNDWIEENGFMNYFDAVFSNAALHWMKNQNEVVKAIYKCLKPGGRFMGEMGGHGNIKNVEDSLIASLEKRGYDGRKISPWYFPMEEEYKQLLNSNSFTVEYLTMFQRPTHLPTDLAGWIETFGFKFFEGLNNYETEEVKQEVESECRKESYDEKTKNWILNYVRLRFVAIANK